MKRALVFSLLLGAIAVVPTSISGQSTTITVPLTYHAPGTGPKPNFSPKGTQVSKASAVFFPV